MHVYQYTAFVADYNLTHPEKALIRLERVATKKKPHIIIEAYYERSDTDCLIALRIIDWQTLEEIPSFYIDSALISKKFDALEFRVDFIP